MALSHLEQYFTVLFPHTTCTCPLWPGYLLTDSECLIRESKNPHSLVVDDVSAESSSSATPELVDHMLCGDNERDRQGLVHEVHR